MEEFLGRNYKDYKVLYDLLQAEITEIDHYPFLSLRQLEHLVKLLDLQVEFSSLQIPKHIKRVDLLRFFIQVSV